MENTELGWRLETDHPVWMWARRPDGKLGRGPKPIRHRHRVYPERFEATWVRDDGLAVWLDIRVDATRGPIPMAVKISGPDGIEGEYRQPVPAMMRQAAAQLAWIETSTPGTISPAPPGRIYMGPVVKRTNEARLRKVAALYNRALAEGREVTELIESQEYVSPSTAYGLIGRARKAGLLPPSRRGRKPRAR